MLHGPERVVGGRCGRVAGEEDERWYVCVPPGLRPSRKEEEA